MRQALKWLLVAICPLPLAAQAARPPAVDYARLADLVVHRTWKLAPGERVVFFWDKAYDRGMASALRAAVLKAGATVEDIAAPTAAAFRQLTPAQLAARDSAWTRIFASAQAAIWLPTALDALADRPFERQVERSRVRSIHFHWFLPPDKADAARVEAMYASAIAVAPEMLLARITAVEGAIRGATVRITSPNGTDLTLEVPKDAWVHRNTGDASKTKVADARSVRDREEELPASVFRTTDLRNAHGTIIGYSSFDTRSPVLKVTFAGGRVAAFESARGAETIVKSWQEATGDKTLPGELVIGTNPVLASVLPSGFMPYYGYGAGVVRMAIGDNWESGGRNRSSNGEVLLFIPDATVVASGVTIVKDGKLATKR